MTTKFARPLATAKRVITEKGDVTTWIVDGGQTFTGVPVLWLPSVQLQYWALQFNKDLEIPTGFRYGLTHGDIGFVPKLRDQVTGQDGVTRLLSSMDVLAPDGFPILYFLYVSE